jgi:DNA-binding NarL/FixJ family response regulator
MCSSPSIVQSALVVKSDRIHAAALADQVTQAFPGVAVEIAPQADAARLRCTTARFDLLLVDLGHTADGDVVDFVLGCLAASRMPLRILVVAGSGEIRSLSVLRLNRITGVFDSHHEPVGRFAEALRVVGEGGVFWSQSVLRRLREDKDANVCLHCLTELEQLVLAAIGDGADDIHASGALDLSPATVSTVRRNLHRKLEVQHRGELVRLAAQFGFVRFTPTGVIRPGFDTLLANYQTHRRKRSTAPHAEPGSHPGNPVESGTPAA